MPVRPGGLFVNMTISLSTPGTKVQPDSRLSITIEVVSLDIPREEVLTQAFEKIRALPNYLKPIVMEGLARKLKVSKKTIDKSFEAWMMERISQIAANDAAQNNNSNNGEEV